MDINKHFLLYANCIPVLGASRSTLCDLQKKKIEFIPNDLYHILQEIRRYTIGELLDQYDEANRAIIQEYLSFLLKEEYGFLCDKDELDWFPEMDLTWESPSFIENAIIDIGAQSHHDYEAIFKELAELGCEAVQLRFYTAISINHLCKILDFLKTSRIQSLDVLLPYTDDISLEILKEIVNEYPRVYHITLHSVPDSLLSMMDKAFEMLTVTNQKVDSSTHCGFISPAYFRIGLQDFSENQAHNNCLNRKISIDIEGNIKNCPAFPNTYGKAGDTPLSAVIKNSDFTRLWYLHKDQVKVCMDCEFRYMCSDCRAFVQDDQDIYSKPAKCTYDPYSMKWSDNGYGDRDLKQKDRS